MRLPVVLLFLFAAHALFAQLPLDESAFFSRVKTGGSLPEKILATRTAVFHSHNISGKELDNIQSYCQRTGIDAVAYFEIDLLYAGRDVSVAMAEYLNKRDISNLIIITKKENTYSFYAGIYNHKANFFEQDQQLYMLENRLLEEILKTVYRTAANAYKKENLLINDFAEMGFHINPIDGRRSEFFAIDLKVDPLAVPQFGNAAMDTTLSNIMKTYPYKYKLTEPGLSESELRKKGYLFVLRFVKARDKVAKEVLGYDMSKSESAIVSLTYLNDHPQIKNIPANTNVHKFYFKHIDSGNVFLGTKWDADESWEQALINQLKAFKAELGVN